MKNHMMWMMIGCLATSLLVFLLPAFGIASNISLLVFIVVMAVCVIPMFMMRGSGEDNMNTDINQPSDHKSSS